VTIVTLWSSIGCIELAQIGGVTAPKKGLGEKLMLVDDDGESGSVNGGILE